MIGVEPVAESSLNLSFPALAGVVDRWRLETVDSARCGAMPHVSLLYPWAAPSIDAGLVERLEHAVADIGRLDVTFSEVGRFPTVVWLRPEPEPEIRALSDRLAEAFPEYPRYGGMCPDPQPYLTVAISQDPARLDEIESELHATVAGQALGFTVSTVDIAERRLDRQWVVNTRVDLKPGGRSG